MVAIWIDNDGCPKVVRELVYKTCLRVKVPTFVVGNSYAKVPIDPLIKMICVPGGFDEADNYIADHLEAGQLVITADIPLAHRVVTKGAFGLSPRGEVFDRENIDDRLATRNLLQELRSGDGLKGGPPPFGDGDVKKFAAALDRTITKLIKSRN